ncbi:hypothetical protein PAHAL_1G238200 [Panicum hallii]|uniref:X8 domain-containing protein n=1 Tax=Panicum hallii TaxID=206008 RepID=A0A2T8KW70_9POAL|nr:PLASMODESMATA CALLOSE-BINDING PROTEIN 3-like isoform X2 [Panicum hallii]PVH66415.1 hypothetical protein PAHAL_1G238200 [Panicum hallii]
MLRRRGRLPAAPWLVAVTLSALLLAAARPAVGAAAWCIARSGASEKALQSALDYACGPAGGADCAPIQASGLCYLPNTLAAHASYAFNSIFQRSRAAPGACDFAGTATVTLTDPSQLWIMHLPFISKHCRAIRNTRLSILHSELHV